MCTWHTCFSHRGPIIIQVIHNFGHKFPLTWGTQFWEMQIWCHDARFFKGIKEDYHSTISMMCNETAKKTKKLFQSFITFYLYFLVHCCGIPNNSSPFGNFVGMTSLRPLRLLQKEMIRSETMGHCAERWLGLKGHIGLRGWRSIKPWLGLTWTGPVGRGAQVMQNESNHVESSFLGPRISCPVMYRASVT